MEDLTPNLFCIPPKGKYYLQDFLFLNTFLHSEEIFTYSLRKAVESNVVCTYKVSIEHAVCNKYKVFFFRFRRKSNSIAVDK